MIEREMTSLNVAKIMPSIRLRVTSQGTFTFLSNTHGPGTKMTSSVASRKTGLKNIVNLSGSSELFRCPIRSTSLLLA